MKIIFCFVLICLIGWGEDSLYDLITKNKNNTSIFNTKINQLNKLLKNDNNETMKQKVKDMLLDANISHRSEYIFDNLSDQELKSLKGIIFILDILKK